MPADGISVHALPATAPRRGDPPDRARDASRPRGSRPAAVRGRGRAAPIARSPGFRTSGSSRPTGSPRRRAWSRRPAAPACCCSACPRTRTTRARAPGTTRASCSWPCGRSAPPCPTCRSSPTSASASSPTTAPAACSRDGEVDNDPTLELLARAPSRTPRRAPTSWRRRDMMDGRVGAIRTRSTTGPLSRRRSCRYSAKYASAFYGPFREAAGSAPKSGDRKGYQIDPANGGEALRESLADVEEGADMLMVKPRRAVPRRDRARCTTHARCRSRPTRWAASTRCSRRPRPTGALDERGGGARVASSGSAAPAPTSSISYYADRGAEVARAERVARAKARSRDLRSQAPRRGLPPHPRRRQQPGARHARGRARHPLFIARAQRGLRRGRRRQPLRRPRRLVGPDDPRPRRPRRARRSCARPPARGTSFGAPTVLEIELAEAVKRRDAVDRARALRQLGHRGHDVGRAAGARATGRDKILKFAGCYHGHADVLLVEAGSGLATLGIPARPGVPPRGTADTLRAPYNDLARVREAIAAPRRRARRDHRRAGGRQHGRRAARADGFLEGLRELPATSCGALLVFDEVITGFRVARGGAQERYSHHARPDVLGKIVGGGLPAAAYGGRGDVMELVAPLAPSTRRARSRATRSRWRRASRR